MEGSRPTSGESPGEGRFILSVAELTRRIRGRLEQIFPAFWVEGEVSNLKRPRSSGHLYFTLKDEHSQVRAFFPRTHAARLRFELRDGLRALVFGSLSVYEARGEYQIQVEDVEPKGIGA